MEKPGRIRARIKEVSLQLNHFRTVLRTALRQRTLIREMRLVEISRSDTLKRRQTDLRSHDLNFRIVCGRLGWNNHGTLRRCHHRVLGKGNPHQRDSVFRSTTQNQSQLFAICRHRIFSGRMPCNRSDTVKLSQARLIAFE